MRNHTKIDESETFFAILQYECEVGKKSRYDVYRNIIVK